MGYKEMKKTSKTIDYAKIFRMDAGFYHYNGSFTTPPCTENVEYLVMDSPVQMTADQLKHLRNKVGYPGSARPVQKKYRRKITPYSKPNGPPPFRFSLSDQGQSTYKPQPPTWALATHCDDKESHPSTETENKYS